MERQSTRKPVVSQSQPLKAGLSLVELVVTISVLSIIITLMLMMIMTIARSYIQGRGFSQTQTELQVTLLQIAQQFSAALSPSVEFSRANNSLQFDTVLTAGIANKMRNGSLTDEDNTQFELIKTGMILQLLPWKNLPNRMRISRVDSQNKILGAENLSNNHSSGYWALDRHITYDLNEKNLNQTIETYADNTTQTFLLCKGVDDFVVTRITANHYKLELQKFETDLGSLVTESLSVALK